MNYAISLYICLNLPCCLAHRLNQIDGNTDQSLDPLDLNLACDYALGIQSSNEKSRRLNKDDHAIEPAEQHRRRLFSFTSKCDFGEVAAAFVSVNNGIDDLDWGASPESPFKSISYAVSNRQPCQTIYIMEGTYNNINYGNSINNGPVVSLTNVKDLKITNYENDSVIVQFDGRGGFLGNGVENVEISGLEIIGPNSDISYEEASINRLNSKSKYMGRGIAIWSGHHIYIHDMIVHHCPGSGIRANNGDYITVSNSQVYSNTWWTSAAESALVFAASSSFDEIDEVKMVMTNNTVWNNVNKIPFYNKNLCAYPIAGGIACSTITACKEELIDGCPWKCRYGKKTQDYIIHGSGVYVARNNNSSNPMRYLHGKMELSDNTSYGNGINGLVCHKTDRCVIRNNVIFGNGVVTRLDKNETLEDWQENLGQSRQKYSGLTLNNAKDAYLEGNRVAAKYDDDVAFKALASTISTNPGDMNKVCRGKVDAVFNDIVSFMPCMDVCTTAI